MAAPVDTNSLTDPVLPDGAPPALTRWFTDRISSSLDEPTGLDRLTVTGTGDLVTPFPLLDLAAASFAAGGLAVGQLLHDCAGTDLPAVTVDRRDAGVWFDVPFAPTRYVDAPERHGAHVRWMAEFETADERWVRVQAGFPTLRRRMCEALGVEETPEAVARAFASLDAEEAELRIVRAGGVAAVGRSLREWQESEAAEAVAGEPIAAMTPTLEGAERWSPHPLRPLLGLRVLDMTRVVAAPMATRLLAALGAEVLRLDPPGGDEAVMMPASDIVLGKRRALLDVKSRDGRDRYRDLLASADVFVHGYRPGAIDGLGFDEAARAEISPGLVEVTLSTFGWSGPLSARRGFDTITQFASGLAHEYSRWAAEDPEQRLPMNSLGHQVDASRPRILPVEVLDFSTGYQVAAAAVAGLRRRLLTGRGSITKLSLARTSALLVEPLFTPADETVTLPYDMPVGPRVHEMNRRPSQRVRFPFAVDGVDLFWDRPAEDAGASAPQWATHRAF